MFLRGSLSTMNVSELLQWLEHNRKSGTVQIDTKDFWKKLYLRDGCIIFASSNRDRERLGQFLIRKGVLDERELDECLARVRRTGDVRKLSDVLVDLGYLTQQQLTDYLTELIQEIVYDSFLNEAGDFEFRDAQLPPEVLEGFTLSPQEIAMEALRRLDEYKHDRVNLPDESLVLEATAVSVDKIESVLGAEGKELYQLVDGRSSAQQVLERSQMPLYSSQKLLLTLIGGGAITPRPRSEVEKAAPVTAAASGSRGSGLRIEGPGGQNGSLEQRVGPPETLLFPRTSFDKSGALPPLDAEEGFVLSRITERCTVKELVAVAGTRRERAYEILWSLIRKGYVRTQRP